MMEVGDNDEAEASIEWLEFLSFSVWLFLLMVTDAAIGDENEEEDDEEAAERVEQVEEEDDEEQEKEEQRERAVSVFSGGSGEVASFTCAINNVKSSGLPSCRPI